VPIDALESDRVLADPWILVPALFAPGYVSGWSVAEHWDLTEQIFNDIVVKTCRSLRSRERKVHGISFVLRHIKEEHLFGTKTRWRGQTRVSVADIHRCLVDMPDEPFLGGGIQHVADCFHNYIRRKDSNFATLVDYADKLGNGAVFKRLGFLSERERVDHLVESCTARLTSGNAKLDSGVACPRLITRWRLLVPDSWTGQ
jgi:predicted transcriptional regulator of viral defense system